MTATFKDHFSTQSDGYAKYRPTYPPELFHYLASLVTGHRSAWDCATGNGQVAIALAAHFSEVIATDASQAQIDAAIENPRISYRRATAERSQLDDSSVDLVTVGQAFHWFDEQKFGAEACRVLRPGGVLAIWGYQLCTVNPTCDSIVAHLYRDIVGDFWPAERTIIEQGYSESEIPGEALSAPDLRMSARWHLGDMLGFLRTWSACERYKAKHGTDPVAAIESDLESAWGDGQRSVNWPMTIKLSRLNTLLE